MPSTRSRPLLVAVIQYAVGLALLPLEPQYGLLVIGHHHVVGRLRPLTPSERLYVTVAIAIHTVGVTFPEHLYREFAWYDNVTHFMSGSLVAGLLIIVLSRHVKRFHWVAAMTVFTMVFVGIGWEMYEYHTPRLRVYGWGDTVSDIWTNLFGTVAMLTYIQMRTWVWRADIVSELGSQPDERRLG